MAGSAGRHRGQGRAIERRFGMSAADFIDEQTEKVRVRSLAREKAGREARVRERDEHKLGAVRRGEPFDEPHPDSESAGIREAS